jgi:hypothetical protein
MEWISTYSEIDPKGACLIRVCTTFSNCDRYWCWRLEG